MEMFFSNKEVIRAWKNVVKKLNANGFKGAIVGGAVRDILMGKTPTDIDIATNATPGEVCSIFKGAKLVGESFGVCRWNGYEIATYRNDVHNGIGDACCTVKYTNDLIEDLRRRDFTMNACAYERHPDGTTRFVMAQAGCLDDIENKRLDFVGNAEDRIREDPNRIFRAYRMICKTGFLPSYDTAKIIYNRGIVEKYLPYIAPERIGKELIKSMEEPFSWNFFRCLYRSGIMYTLIPEMAQAWNIWGGKYHAEYVGEHLMAVGMGISAKFPLLRLAGYLHDVGKGVTHEDGSFIRHEKEGVHIARRFLKSLKFSTKDTEKVCNIIRCHMRRFGENETPATNRRTLAYLAKHNVCTYDFIRLRIADHNGNFACKKMKFRDIKSLVKCLDTYQFEKQAAHSRKMLAINGRDIMKEFNLPPSRLVGEMIEYAHNIVLDNVDKNEYSILINEIKKRFGGSNVE